MRKMVCKNFAKSIYGSFEVENLVFFDNFNRILKKVKFNDF